MRYVLETLVDGVWSWPRLYERQADAVQEAWLNRRRMHLNNRVLDRQWHGQRPSSIVLYPRWLTPNGGQLDG